MFSQEVAARLGMQGHTLHLDRSTYTHALFAGEVSDLASDHEITENGEPIWVEALGRNLIVGDVLPERLALGVDGTGEIVGQADFEQRYEQYLRGFGTDQEPGFEPKPNVKAYLMKQVDPTRPPENGKAYYVDLGFDPRAGGEAKETGEWHPDGIKMDEWLKSNPQALVQPNENEARIRELIALHAAGDITAETLAMRVAALHGDGANEPATVTPESVPEPTAPPAAEGLAPGMEAAPCGDTVKAGYVKQHQRFCKDDACLANPVAD